MSVGNHSFPTFQHNADVLGELLHSLSQPLTSLRCSLELSIEENADKQRRNAVIALQQTDRVIGMIQLMREYLDAEQHGPQTYSTSLATILRNVVAELSSITAVRGVRLRLVGTSATTVALPEPRLRLALQYVIASVAEMQPIDGKVMLLLGEGPGGAVLRAEGECVANKPARTSGSVSALRKVRLAIASRMLENAGASLVFSEGGVSTGDCAPIIPYGFVLRIPRRVATYDAHLAPLKAVGEVARPTLAPF